MIRLALLPALSLPLVTALALAVEAAVPGDREKASSDADEIPAPPGLANIAGGRTRIGSKEEEVRTLIEKTGLRVLVGEIEEHEVKLDEFWLMRTEVTNEQYLVYVQSTHTKPPRSWAEDVINAAIGEFVRTEQEKYDEKKQAGEAYERRKADPEWQARWWEDNWSKHPYSVPQGTEAHPVVWVTYEEARNYARWAGLRLMSEQEFQRAGRGDSSRSYVWGDEFDLERCATVERKFQGTSPVGSFPGGTSEQGIVDLCGNVWEWTSSPFIQFPGYKPLLSVKIGTTTETALASFNADERVAVGGCYKAPKEAARLTTRRASERSQTTDSLGFRCAATPRAGYDVARAILDTDVSVYAIPEGTSFESEIVVAMDRWESRGGTAGVTGYEVITGYRHVLFVPVSALEFPGLPQLEERSVEGEPVMLGLLSTTEPLVEPALAPGTYFVAYRAAGEPKDAKRRGQDPAPAGRGETGETGQTGEEAAVVEGDATEIPGLDRKVESYVFYDLQGKPLLAIKAPPSAIAYESKKLGSITSRLVEPTEEQRQYGVEPQDQIDLAIAIAGTKSSSRLFVADLRLKLGQGSVTSFEWRRSSK